MKLRTSVRRVAPALALLVIALGTSLNFAVFVLTLHVVWSVGSSVALAEGLAGSRWREPWLHRTGLIVIAVLLLIGCAFTTIFTLRTFPFIASPVQFGTAAVVLALVVTLAFAAFPPREDPPNHGTCRADS